MSTGPNTLSDGVRQAILDSGKAPYQFRHLPKVSPQSLYRFIGGTRNLSQRAFDEIGLFLKLNLTHESTYSLKGHRMDYRLVFEESKRSKSVDEMIRGTGASSLSKQLGNAVKLHRKGLEEIASIIVVSSTQMYRFLDGTRGLSQVKLDALCSALKLFVEAPTALVHSHRPGGMITGRRRVYQPRPAARPAPEVAEESQPSPPSLYLPSKDAIDGES